MSIEVIPYSPAHEAEWDVFCAAAVNATLLHTRLFLSYHGERFKDASLLLKDENKLLGVFPAAQSLDDERCVVSHPGVTYGGVVHQGRLCGTKMIDAFTAIGQHYMQLGCQRLHYKPVPYIYTALPAQDDIYALFRLGAQRIRSELSSSINLAQRAPVSERRKRGLKKALKTVVLSDDPALLPQVWNVVADNLARKHEAKPTHSLAELCMLRDRFENQIITRSALIDGKVEAGVVFFNSTRVWHAQYIAASSAAYDVSALDAVFDAAISEAALLGVRFFDFGTSNEQGGKVLNDGLYSFKTEFGGGGLAQEVYEINLNMTLENHGN